MNILQQKVPLYFLVGVVALGLLMRSSMWLDTGIPYTHMMHAHSHVGFQGWIYLMLFILSTRLFLSEELLVKGRYRLQFNLTVSVLVLMLVAFLWQGYAALSIALSTLFQVLNYWFVLRFWKDLDRIDVHPIPRRFVQIGLLFGILSTLAPYYVGYLSAIEMKGSPLYSAALYFFFHFQYNGWFLFVLFGLFYQWLIKEKGVAVSRKDHLFLVVMVYATPLTYALSILGLGFDELIRWVAYAGGVLTLVSLYFLPLLIQHLKMAGSATHSLIALLWVFVLSFAIKQVLQLISLFPDVEAFAFHNRFAVITFLHWCFLFVLTSGLIGLAYLTRIWKHQPINIIGVILFGVGAIASEFTLLGLAWGWPVSTAFLWWASLLMFLGVLLLLLIRDSQEASE